MRSRRWRRRGEHPNLWVISDDIYNRMIFDGLEYSHLVKVVRNCAIASC
jgi:Aspartate/tyrosine/aromatic aminotransferase